MASDLSYVKLYYFNYFRTGGLGEPIKMLLEDAEIPNLYIQIERSTQAWEEMFRKELIASDKPFDCLPFLETKDGKRFFCSGPILRFLAKKLGMFDGMSEEDIQFLDAVHDLSKDWYMAFALYVARPIVPPEQQKVYFESECARHTQRIERLYGMHGGSYLLGPEISYPDYFVYHSINEQRRIIGDLKAYPNLAQLMDAFEQRPNMKRYLASLPPKQLLPPPPPAASQ